MNGEEPAAIPVELRRYDAVVEEDDPHAAFKREVRAYTRQDPLPTFEELSALTGVPVGALLRYALVRWAAEGSEALLALGPRAVEHLWQAVQAADEAGTDADRLEAWERVRGLLAWLRAPLRDEPRERPPGHAPAGDVPPA